MTPFSAGGHRESTNGLQRRSDCSPVAVQQWGGSCVSARRHRSRTRSGSRTRLPRGIHDRSRQHSQRHRRADAPRASQNPRLNLTFPKSPARHARAAVQSNEVYPTPPALARLTSLGRASDKRFPLWRSLHNGRIRPTMALIVLPGSGHGQNGACALVATECTYRHEKSATLYLLVPEGLDRFHPAPLLGRDVDRRGGHRSMAEVLLRKLNGHATL